MCRAGQLKIASEVSVPASTSATLRFAWLSLASRISSQVMLAFATTVAAFLLPPMPSSSRTELSPRDALLQGAGTVAAAAAALSATPALAGEEFSRMGGLLEPYIDVQRGFKLYTPSGWNKFDADPGVYDVKFQDIIEPETTVQVATSPVQTATSVTALGELAEVGEKFAKSRNAVVVQAFERTVGESLVYAASATAARARARLSFFFFPRDCCPPGCALGAVSLPATPRPSDSKPVSWRAGTPLSSRARSTTSCCRCASTGASCSA